MPQKEPKGVFPQEIIWLDLLKDNGDISDVLYNRVFLLEKKRKRLVRPH